MYQYFENELNEKIEILRTTTEKYGNYYDLQKQIKKMKIKLKKKPELSNDLEFSQELSKLQEHLKIVLSAETEIFKIQNHIKTSINKLNKKWNSNDLKILKKKNRVNKFYKYLKIQRDANYKRENLNKLSQDITNISEKLQFHPKNLALKVDLYDKLRKMRDINKKIAIAYFKDSDVLSEKINSEREKSRRLEDRSAEYTFKINELHTLYDHAKKELTKNKKIENEKSFVVENLNVFYGKKQALYNVNIEFPKNKVISIIGPSGCGKSTFLRTLNRINDEIASFNVDGRILLDGEYDIYKLKSIRNHFDKIELTELRTKVGMIFQQPNPFPISIYKNVAYGPKINGYKNKAYLNNLVKKSLISAALWDEVKENIHTIGTSLSGGQQQRLCIARAIANKPEILLMDEPTSALDPIAASKIESLILELKKEFTIIMVTHSMQQAARISDYTAFFYNGKLVEFDETKKLFSKPKRKRTDDYIRGRFG